MCTRSSYFSFHIFIWQKEYAAYLLPWIVMGFMLLLSNTNRSAAKWSTVGRELPGAAGVCDCFWTLSSLINHHVLLETHWTFTKSQQPVWIKVKLTIIFPPLLLSHSIKLHLRETCFFPFEKKMLRENERKREKRGTLVLMKHTGKSF